MAAVGKPRDAALAAAIREYETRAARYWPIEVVEVREEPSRGASADVVMRKEGERLLGRLPAGARLVLCDPEGDTLDSAAFAAFLQERREAAQDVAFVLGGALNVQPPCGDREAERGDIEAAKWSRAKDPGYLW